MRILNLEPEGYSPKARTILETIAEVIDGPMDRLELLGKVKDIDVLIVRLGHKIDEEVINAAQALKIIVTATTGLNHIDLQAASNHSIVVLSLKGEREFLNSIVATVEHTWVLLLALIRSLPFAHDHVCSGGWDRDKFKGRELHGRTLGIVGLGRIGSKVAGIAKAFAMNVIGCDTDTSIELPEGVVLRSFHHVLAHSDVISLHVDYSPENHAMIGIEELSLVTEGSLLINTSRGELIDEAALVKSLESGRLAGAGLDVLCGENSHWGNSAQLIDYARTHTNLIITPHIGGCTYDSMEKTEIFMAQKLLSFFQAKM